MKKIEHIIILILLLLVLMGGFFLVKTIKQKNDKIEQAYKLQAALTDTTKYFQNKKGEWVAEKLTLQADIKDIEKQNIVLSEDKKELITRVKKLQRDKNVITAALIKMGIKVDSLTTVLANVTIDIDSAKINFVDKTDKDFQYNIDALNVYPSDSLKLPMLRFNNIEFPNKQFIVFNWEDNKKLGYPVSFSVTNTNKYINVYNIESYAIPEIKKEDLDPTFWMKLGNFFGSTTGKIIIFVAGGTTGYLLAK